MNAFLKRGLCAVALVAALALSARADTLAEGLLKHAPELLEYAREKGYKNVGVLKFLVQKGNARPSDSVGTLNSTLADRLETALLLSQNPDKEVMGIIEDASSVAAKLNGASHLTEDGRKQLFKGKYRLCWGDEKFNVTADAFVTGVAELPADRPTMRVRLEVIDKDGKSKEFDAFDVSPSGKVYTEAGRDFLLLRGAGGQFKKERLTTTLVREDAGQLASGKVKPVFEAGEDAPVSLKILYSIHKDFRITETRKYREVPYLIGPDGTASVEEPREGESVALLIRKNPKFDGRFGIVVKVNGESTLFREKVSPLRCMKWILDGEHGETLIRGYRVEGTDDRTNRFRVAAPAESEALAVNYGRDVGQISFVVFREKTSDAAIEDPPLEDGGPTADLREASQAKKLLALEFSGQSPCKRQRGKDLQEAQQNLKGEADLGCKKIPTEGLIAPGEETPDVKIRRVLFDPDPVEMMSATISYYRPKK